MARSFTRAFNSQTKFSFLIKMTQNNSSFEQTFSDLTKVFRIFGLQYFTLSTYADNKKFSHHGPQISNRYKIILLLINLSLAANAGAMFLIQEEVFDLKIGTDYAFFVLLILAVWHSYFKTAEFKQIFVHCEKIYNLFRMKLQFDVNCVEKAASIRKIFIRFLIFFAIYFSTYSIFVLVTEPRQFLAAMLLDCLQNILVNLFIMRFMLLVLMVYINIESMTSFLGQIDSDSKVSNLFINKSIGVKNLTTRTIMENVKAFLTLKEIHREILKISFLVNSINGPSAFALCMLSVVQNATAGYEIYAVIEGESPIVSLASEFA